MFPDSDDVARRPLVRRAECPIGRSVRTPPTIAAVRIQRGPVVAGVVVGATAVVLIAAALGLLYPRVAEWTGSSAASARVARGERIYNASCASCHGGPTGGGMMDYPSKHNANGHT